MTAERKWLYTKRAIFCYVALNLLVLIAFCAKHRTYSSSTLPQQINYDAGKICEDAFKTQENHEHEQINNFTVHMTEGCFGHLIHMPSAWHQWWWQPTGDQKGWWASFWWSGWNQGRGPFGPNDKTELNVPSWWFRVQGHGDILFYSNDVVPKPESASPTPDANGIYQVGGLVSQPIPINKVEPEYTPEARAANWKGLVWVEVIIAEDGAVRDPKFPNAPPYGLDTPITEALKRWSFKPAEFNGKAVPVHSKIEFTFEKY